MAINLSLAKKKKKGNKSLCKEAQRIMNMQDRIP